MNEDAGKLVKKCDKGQQHADVHVAPPTELNTLTPPWSFAWWEIDLLGPFRTAPGQLMYLIMPVDYFPKWTEAEPLANITRKNCMKFFKKNIMV